MYWISSRRGPINGNPPVWGLGEGLTTPHQKKKTTYHELLHGTNDLGGLFGTT